MSANLPRVLYKHLLSQRAELADLALLDPVKARSLAAVLFMPAEQVETALGLTFEVEPDGPVTPAWRPVELKPGGAQVPVTGDNRQEFVSLYVQHCVWGSVQQQASALVQGFR